MNEAGAFALNLALAVAVYTSGAAFLGARRRRADLIASAENGAYATLALLTLAGAALLAGKLDESWIRSTRRWTLLSWLGLTLGNLLGAQWAYVELGWGGYWA